MSVAVSRTPAFRAAAAIKASVGTGADEVTGTQLVEQRQVSVAERTATAERSAEVSAEVVSLNVRERAEVTRGSVRLRYTPPAAGAPVERDVELPMSFLKELEGREGETIPIRVVASSDQIVLGAHPRAQWVLTFAFAAMALIGALGLTWMVAAWNRFLLRHGDPAEGKAMAIGSSN